jgi:hypothetical protein
VTTGAAPLVDAAEVTLTNGAVLTQKLLDAGNSATYSYDASACDGFLHVELWDRIRLTPGYDENSYKADPMLMVPQRRGTHRDVLGRGQQVEIRPVPRQ